MLTSRILTIAATNSARPYIFVTNGGGKTEEERCLDLSRQLELEISPGQFICGHSPMREMAEKYGTVLVVGGEGEKCRQVAEGYGFKDVVTPGDIIKDNKHVIINLDILLRSGFTKEVIRPLPSASLRRRRRTTREHGTLANKKSRPSLCLRTVEIGQEISRSFWIS